MLTAQDFKVGMKVKALANAPEGLIGEVKYIDTDDTIAVAFEGFNGYDCGNLLEKDNGWWMQPEKLEIISNDETCSVPTAEQDNVAEIVKAESFEHRMEVLLNRVRHAETVKAEAIADMRLLINDLEGGF